MSERRLSGPRALSYLTLFAGAASGWAALALWMRDVDRSAGAVPLHVEEWLAAWIVLLLAMLLPSMSRMVIAHASIEAARRRAGERVAPATTATFVAAYLLTWTAAGLAAFVVYEAGEAVAGDALHWEHGGRGLAAAVLVAAAAYTLTPVRLGFLAVCRHPIELVLRGWREGHAGAMRMGSEYGLICIGCCAPAMATLIALGAMDFTWVALVAAAIAIEKLGPWGRGPSLAIALAMLAIGIAVAVAPGDVPGLVTPGPPGTGS